MSAVKLLPGRQASSSGKLEETEILATFHASKNTKHCRYINERSNQETSPIYWTAGYKLSTLDGHWILKKYNGLPGQDQRPAKVKIVHLHQTGLSWREIEQKIIKYDGRIVYRDAMQKI